MIKSKYIYGRGGCSFLLQDGQVLFFKSAIVKISQKPIRTIITNNNGKKIIKTKGYRLQFEVQINNYCDDDYIDIMKLLEAISQSTSYDGLDKGLQFYPRTNIKSDIDSIDYLFKGYSVLAINNIITPNRIISGYAPAGQKFKFNFINRSLTNKIKVYQQLSNIHMVDDSDNLIIDNDSDIITIIE